MKGTQVFSVSPDGMEDVSFSGRKDGIAIGLRDFHTGDFLVCTANPGLKSSLWQRWTDLVAHRTAVRDRRQERAAKKREAIHDSRYRVKEAEVVGASEVSAKLLWNPLGEDLNALQLTMEKPGRSERVAWKFSVKNAGVPYLIGIDVLSMDRPGITFVLDVKDAEGAVLESDGFQMCHNWHTDADFGKYFGPHRTFELEVTFPAPGEYTAEVMQVNHPVYPTSMSVARHVLCEAAGRLNGAHLTAANHFRPPPRCTDKCNTDGGKVPREKTPRVLQPIRPESTRVWRPVIDLHFDGDAGVAQWWCPELILMGNTDVMLHADGPIAWQRQDDIWKYEHINPDGKLFVALSVDQIELGWRATLTIGNRTDQTWPTVVSPVCLLLRGSPAFADKDWTRTYFRSGGEFATYHGQETSSGREIYRMSLVDGQQQIERTERHVKKWGFTKRHSDDGIIGVVSNTRGYLGVGFRPVAIGEATVTGLNSQWNNSANLFVGHNGNGTLNVMDGGVVSNTNGLIGSHHPSSTGVATVTGSDSRWNNSGSLVVGQYDDGTLNVEAGGMVNNTGGYISFFSGSTGEATVTGTGSQWNNSGNLYVGYIGTGTLNVIDGGIVTSTNGYIGSRSDTSGTATVTGSGSRWNNSGDLTVSDAGDGTLNIEDQALVTVTGTDSSWTNTYGVVVGDHGTGTLNVENGGSVTGTHGYLGRYSGSSGTATVTGTASSWDNSGSGNVGSGNLYVGHNGTSTLTVADGGSVTDTSGYVGRNSGGDGTATVTGTASNWDNSGGLYIGGSDSSAGGIAAVSVLYGGTLNVGGATKIYAGSTLTLGSSTFTSGGIAMEGGTIAASTALGEEGALYSADVGTVSGYGDISAPVHLGTAGQMAGSGGVLTLSGGVTGSGTLSDLTLDGGQITIGNSPGVMTLEDVLAADNTTFDFSIQGTDPSEYDRLILTGDVILAGMLDVELMNSFSPQIGDIFDLLVLEPGVNLQGGFSNIGLPSLSSGAWDTTGLLSSGNLLVISTGPDPCGLGGDASCSTDDLDALYAVFNTSVPPTDAQFDLNADNVVGEADLTEWLSQGATENGHSSPYLRGDTELDRDVDITDFNSLATHFDPDGATAPHSWTEGNFDGDRDIDITDFNFLASNFAPDGYGASAVPEPSSLLLTLLGLMLLAGARVQ